MKKVEISLAITEFSNICNAMLALRNPIVTTHLMKEIIALKIALIKLICFVIK
jgi:hypothetical protein